MVGITTVDTCQVIQSLLTPFHNFVSCHHLLSLLARSLFGRVSRVYQDVSSVYQKFKKEQWVFDSLQDDRADKWKSSWLPMFFGEAGRKSYSSYASPVVDIKYLCHRLWLDFLIYNQFARKISGLVLMLIGWWWKPRCKKLPLSISWPGSNILFKSNFIPAVVGPFLSGLDYFRRESPFAIFGGLNGAGKLLYFTPILLEIATFHPHIASQGKDFVASGLSGLENQSCLSRSRERREREEESMRNYEFWSWGSPRQIMNSRSLQGKLSGACDARGWGGGLGVGGAKRRDKLCSHLVCWYRLNLIV